jgi:2-dehydropantoate 2-reductase
MKIGIVGQGAIGSLFAYYYQHVSPTLLVKDTNNASKQLLTLDAQPISLDFAKLNISQSLYKNNSFAYFDAIIITVKGYQLPSLVKQLSHCLAINTRIILIQNGMGGAQILAEAFPNNIIYVGTTTDAVYKVDENTYQISAMGKLDIGPLWKMSFSDGYNPNIIDINKEKAWVSALLTCHPNTEYHDEIASALYKKLAINAVINTLTALLQVKNGQLVQYVEEVNTLKTEIFATYSAANIAYSKHALSQAIDDVIKATSNNWSSMQQDIKFKRQTENDSILGYLLTLSQQYRIDTPFIRKLYTQLQDLDNRHAIE